MPILWSDDTAGRGLVTSPWVAPDAAPRQPQRDALADAPGPRLPGPEPGDTLPPVPLPMRPMTIPDLLDGAFAIIKRRPRDVLVLAAAFVIPVQLLSSLLLRDVLGSSGFGGTGLGDPTSSVGIEESGQITGVGSTVLSLLLGVLSLALLAGALAMLVQDWYDGRREPPSRTVVRTLRRSPALLLGAVVVHAMEAVGLLALGIGAYVAMGLLHIVSPVIGAEGTGPFRAVGRSIRLTRARFWRSMAVPALVAIIGASLGIGFQLVPELIVLVTSDSWNWLARAVGATLVQLVVTPFTASVAVLYHLDLRIRIEGYDIERRLRAEEVPR